VRFLETGDFALGPHCAEIGAARWTELVSMAVKDNKKKRKGGSTETKGSSGSRRYNPTKERAGPGSD
jgi:hypothetical protein